MLNPPPSSPRRQAKGGGAGRALTGRAPPFDRPTGTKAGSQGRRDAHKTSSLRMLSPWLQNHLRASIFGGPSHVRALFTSVWGHHISPQSSRTFSTVGAKNASLKGNSWKISATFCIKSRIIGGTAPRSCGTAVTRLRKESRASSSSATGTPAFAIGAAEPDASYHLQVPVLYVAMQAWSPHG